jgi:hypothetical protein
MTRSALVIVLLVLGLGCDELDEFKTKSDEVFHGEVIGSDRDGGPSFIRSGFAARTLMDLTFDPARASAAESRSAGTIDTYHCSSEAERCPAADREQGHFAAAALDPIENLAHDSLSQYDFPGGGRLRNYILGSRFTTPEDPDARVRDALVFISLMENGRVEVRALAQSMAGAEAEFPPLFGVFELERRRQ